MSVGERAADQTGALAAVQQIVGALRVVSASEFVFDGRSFAVDAATSPSLNPSAHPLVTCLRDALYERAFVKPLGAPAQPPEVPIANFGQQLSLANASHDRWHEGWQIESALPAGQVRARKYDMVRTWWPGEYLVRDGAPQALRPLTRLGVFWARESHVMQTGFYFAFGEAIADEEDEAQLLRVYWNVSAAGALRLLANATRVLNRFAVPFRFKCVNAAQSYARLDAAVLYIGRRYYRVLRELLPELLSGLAAPMLGEATPIFTLRLGSGVALAEDPLGGESFGMNRCRIVAEGLWAAHAEGLTGVEHRAARVAAQFEAYGLSLPRAHLNPASTFDASV